MKRMMSEEGKKEKEKEWNNKNAVGAAGPSWFPPVEDFSRCNHNDKNIRFIKLHDLKSSIRALEIKYYVA